MLISSLLFFMCFCKKERTSTQIRIKKPEKIIVNDTTINNINPKFIGRKILGKEKKLLINKYYLAINREIERPEMADSFMSNIDSLFEISEYKTVLINNINTKTYIVKIHFEDAKYESILLVLDKENYPYNCLVIYEMLKSEEDYKCYSNINNNIITVNRIGYSRKSTEKYIVKQNNFLNYFDNSQIDIPEWGPKEFVYTKDGLDSTYQYLYIMEGKIKNHLKNGVWDEKRYLLEYDRSVWIHGEYVEGVRNGEWIYREGDPLSKNEFYEMGKLIKTY